MSVQRYGATGQPGSEPEPYPLGLYVLYADHARIVAEATAEARAAERRHWEARFRNAEQAHAAALAGMYELGKADGHLLGEEKAHRDSVIVHEGAAESRGYRRGLAAAPRTLTADDPEPAVGSVVLDHGGLIVCNHAGHWYFAADDEPFMWGWLSFPVTLIHDGEDR